MANDYKVYAAAPQISGISGELRELGAVPVEFSLQRTGLNPLSDLRTILELRKIILEHRIQLIFPYTIKPVLYGSLAGRLCGVPVVSLITGLGFTFSGHTTKARWMQRITQWLYRWALKKNQFVVFQNRDDLQLFREDSIISASLKTLVVNGSGVHLDRYPFRIRKRHTANIRFVMVGRLIREKGVLLFFEAAQQLKSEFPEAEFHLIGSPDGSSSSIDPLQLRAFHDKGIIAYHGFQQDVSSWLSQCDVFVLPSYYREGVPRSILEALSIGMPVITTNMPGCRETVVNGRNGYLIEPKSVRALTEAMRIFLLAPVKVSEMGIESRRLAEARFDVHLINKQLLTVLSKVPGKIWPMQIGK